MRVVLCNCPASHAMSIARTLVEERLAACVNAIPGVASVYRWDGRIVEDQETTLLINTADDRMEALEARLNALHPYSVPEIVALDVAHVNGPYAQWVQESTR